MLSTASGMVARAWQRIRNAQTRVPLNRLIVRLARGSLALLLGGSMLLYLRNNATDQGRPYIATDADRAAERRVQRRALRELILGPQSEGLPAAVTIPVSPSEAPPATQRKSAEQIGKLPEKPKPHAVPKSVPLPEPVGVERALRLLDHFADQMSGINIELRNISSRVAVMEYRFQQPQEKGWYDWCAQIATMLGAVGTALAGLFAALKWLWHKFAPFMASRQPPRAAVRKPIRVGRGTATAAAAAKERSRRSP